jgi:hypothetical protein
MTSDGRSVDIVRSRTQSTEFVFCSYLEFHKMYIFHKRCDSEYYTLSSGALYKDERFSELRTVSA